MLHSGDLVFLFLLMIGVIYFMITYVFRSPSPYGTVKDEEITGPVPKWLNEEGYTVIAEKERTPVWIQIGDDTFESRLYTDYLATRSNQLYVVVVAKRRKPLRYTGAALRDYFLPHYLAYKPAGILYLDMEKQQIEEIRFTVEVGYTPSPRRTWVKYLVAMGVGACLVILLQ
ncbi:hypothetical protein [Mechercharimyces sp. CAU 1602]|uniref:hypothetical protein n=1 Tax=Mechercharimyces sp. CAU 1602 TaxID=2973933 RepID=UPI002161ABEE|nr:hypothetical protein [Mechercharimyces sp. CAU 1602]MCS1350792.1 hypothetical protein [Mechercharimyces sp. CAU 1602]